MLTKEEQAQAAKDVLLDDMDDSISAQSALIYYWGVRADQADNNILIEKATFDETVARIEDELRRKYADESGTAREKRVASEVILDPRYKAAQGKFFDAKLRAADLNVIVKALDNKRAMLKLKHERMLSRLNPENADRLLKERINPAIVKRLEAEEMRDQVVALREAKKHKVVLKRR